MRRRLAVLLVLISSFFSIGFAQTNENHPLIFILNSQQASISKADFFGGSKNGKWTKLSDYEIKLDGKVVNADNYLEDPTLNGRQVEIGAIYGGERFRLYSGSGLIGSVQCGKPTFTVDGYGNEMLAVNFSPIKTKEDFIIGINGEWNAMPRIPKKLKKANSYLIDIEGDGKSEVLKLERIKANSDADRDEPGVRIVLTKGSKVIPINKIPLDGVYSAKYKVAAMDLNGDGHLEILNLSYGHNVLLEVFEIVNNQAVRVLDYYEGD